MFRCAAIRECVRNAQRAFEVLRTLCSPSPNRAQVFGGDSNGGGRWQIPRLECKLKSTLLRGSVHNSRKPFYCIVVKYFSQNSFGKIEPLNRIVLVRNCVLGCEVPPIIGVNRLQFTN